MGLKKIGGREKKISQSAGRRQRRKPVRQRLPLLDSDDPDSEVAMKTADNVECNSLGTSDTQREQADEQTR